MFYRVIINKTIDSKHNCAICLQNLYQICIIFK